MRIVLAGDLHIGRASTAVPDRLALDRRRTVRAWEAIVDLAIREQATAVCLSGDVADENNKFFEAVGPLERGVNRLADAGIAVYAVAGNHDHDLLPRLADELGPERFRLIGRSGQWERVTLHHDGWPVLHLDGWSFPDRIVDQDPLTTYPQQPHDGVPTLGLVHGDLDAPSSRYAPLDPRKLRNAPVDGWLLGHIHAPRLLNDDNAPFLLYPGSPQAMDPGEPGRHGAWLAEIEAGGIQTPRLRPLSTVRYEQLAVELDQVQSPTQLHSTTRETIRHRARHLAAEAGEALACLSLRVTLQGRTPVYDQLPDFADELLQQFDERLGDEVFLFLDRVEPEAEPAIDLEQCATEDTAIGAAARLLLELKKTEPADPVPHLIRQARERIRTARESAYYANLPDEPPVDDTLARQYLERQARALLNELHSQAIS